jgi:hypothetical protein
LGAFTPAGNCRTLQEHAADLRSQLKPLSATIQARHTTGVKDIFDDYEYPVLSPSTVALSIRI